MQDNLALDLALSSAKKAERQALVFGRSMRSAPHATLGTTVPSPFLTSAS